MCAGKDGRGYETRAAGFICARGKCRLSVCERESRVEARTLKCDCRVDLGAVSEIEQSWGGD